MRSGVAAEKSVCKRGCQASGSSILDIDFLSFPQAQAAQQIFVYNAVCPRGNPSASCRPQTGLQMDAWCLVFGVALSCAQTDWTKIAPIGGKATNMISHNRKRSQKQCRRCQGKFMTVQCATQTQLFFFQKTNV